MKRLLFVLSMVVMAVSIFFAGSGIALAQGDDEEKWPMYTITYGKGIIMTSPDGETWTTRSSGVDVPLAAMAYGKGTFVAVGARGTIVTSPKNGETWTIRQSGVTSDLWAVKFSRTRGIFLAVGAAGTVTTSPDGYTWTKRANLIKYSLRNVGYGKDNFITIGERGNIFNSKDGISWKRHGTQFTDHLVGMTYGKGMFVVVGSNGRILTSSDNGVTWIGRYSGTTENLSAVQYGNNKFVAVGAYGTIVESPDGINWATASSGSQSWLLAIAYANKLFIVVAEDGTILTSPDGTNWSFSRYGPIKEKVVVLKYEPRVVEKIVIMAAEPKVEEKVVVAAAEPRIIILAFEDVHFDFDKSTLKPEAQEILKRNIQMLKDNPKAKVRIAGYTSASGTEAYNQELSERRAAAVQKYLINEGIVTPDRLSTIGYGETNPAVYEATPKELYSVAAKANMRVLFEIIVQ
jgi:outer membrane protein OmpA-like peptidoglycan-associated protein